MATRTIAVAVTTILMCVGTVGMSRGTSVQSLSELSTPDIAMAIAGRGMFAGLVVSLSAGGRDTIASGSPLSFDVPSGFDRWVRSGRSGVAELLKSPTTQGPSVLQLFTDFATAHGKSRWVTRSSQHGVDMLADVKARICEASLRRRTSRDNESTSIQMLMSKLAQDATGAPIRGGFIGSCISPQQSLPVAFRVSRGTTLDDALSLAVSNFGGGVWVAVQSDNGTCSLGILQQSTQEAEICVAAITPHLGNQVFR